MIGKQLGEKQEMAVDTLTSLQPNFSGLFKNYTPLLSVCDEYLNHTGTTSAELQTVLNFFDKIPHHTCIKLQQKAQELFELRGVTFNVYSDNKGQEKIFPFDLIPRIIENSEWNTIEHGLKQRLQALNLFLSDIYGKQRILKDGLLPKEIILSSKGYFPQLQGITPPGGIHIHVGGIDLIREHGHLMILEDNLKVPSGVSYVLENRQISKRLLPQIFSQIPIQGIDDYPLRLRDALHSLLPSSRLKAPKLAVLTPGPYNSAYFEHLYLAKRMGASLVQNTDLVVIEDKVFLKTHSKLVQIDILYRRIDDEYIDPEVFKADSLLGVPGLMRAYSTGNVVLANAPGNGVADDKGVYPYVPEIIRYYLGEEPIIPQVETYCCADAKACEHVLNNLDKLVVKIVHQSGGYGIVIGTQASKEQLLDLKAQIIANPRDYIAQPVKQLSTSPTFNNEGISPRRMDFRAFVVSGKNSWVLPGGLTRVALEKGSYIVNSSQGGGAKDSWILGAS